MEEMRGASVAGSSFLGRERTAVDVDVCPERRSPRYHETCLALERERWVLFKIPRCDIDGAGEGKGPSLQGYTDRVLKKAARRYVNRRVFGCACPSSQISKKRVKEENICFFSW